MPPGRCGGSEPGGPACSRVGWREPGSRSLTGGTGSGSRRPGSGSDAMPQCAKVKSPRWLRLFPVAAAWPLVWGTARGPRTPTAALPGRRLKKDATAPGIGRWGGALPRHRAPLCWSSSGRAEPGAFGAPSPSPAPSPVPLLSTHAQPEQPGQARTRARADRRAVRSGTRSSRDEGVEEVVRFFWHGIGTDERPRLREPRPPPLE